MNSIRQIRLKIEEIFEIDPQTAERPKEFAAITEYVLKHYGFLPKPIAVTVEKDDVVISYPEEPDAKREEAARLAARGVKRAGEGQYEKAIGIYKRVLELQPSFHAARRDLAMAYMESGDVENATNHLIEVLRLDPKDAWSWVVLGNLYIREKGDLETGEKFLRKALEIVSERLKEENPLSVKVSPGSQLVDDVSPETAIDNHVSRNRRAREIALSIFSAIMKSTIVTCSRPRRARFKRW